MAFGANIRGFTIRTYHDRQIQVHQGPSPGIGSERQDISESRVALVVLRAPAGTTPSTEPGMSTRNVEAVQEDSPEHAEITPATQAVRPASPFHH